MRVYGTPMISNHLFQTVDEVGLTMESEEVVPQMITERTMLVGGRFHELIRGQSTARHEE